MRIVKIFLSLLLLFIVTPSVFAEEIVTFTQSTAIQTDGTIQITEVINYDFGSADKHGIFRTIPKTKTNTEGKRFLLSFSDISVTDETNTSYQWKREDTSETFKLKIGDPNKTITGMHTYTLRYKVFGALTYFSDHDELYWNITGDEWNVPISTASATITLPITVDPTQLRLLCYQGTHGSTDTCITDTNNTTTQITANKSLSSYEGMTVVFGFPKGIVAVLEPREIGPLGENPLVTIFIIVGGFGWYIVLPAYIGYRWWKKGRDPRPTIGQASVWFSPPKGENKRELTPAETGTLRDERADLADISATIVHLAERGYLTFVEDKNKKLTLVKNTLPKGDVLLPFEQTLYDAIFDIEDIVNVKDLKIVSEVETVKKQLYESVVREGYFLSNPDTIRNLFLVLSMLGLITGNIPLLISALLFGQNMPRKTQLGSDQNAIANSLKNFLSSQEKHMTFQAKEYMLFEKLLPYAVAFGVEKLWAKRFAEINLPPPTWYKGNWSTYNSTVLASNLSSSMTTMTKAMTPTSSSSGFGSGSSGGFSGGGGGGGGGGSW